MQTFETTGLIIKDKPMGDTDALLTLLTQADGVITAYAKGARRAKGKLTASTELLCYGKFRLAGQGDAIFLDAAEPIERFFALRQDVNRLALGVYFGQLAYYFNAANPDTSKELRLLLNTLHFLSRPERGFSKEVLKALYEWRSVAMAGYAPRLEQCAACGKTEGDQGSLCYFSMAEGLLFCEACGKERPGCYALGQGLLAAVHHMVSAPIETLFRFSIAPSLEQPLAALAEAYLLAHLEFCPPALTFYHSLVTQTSLADSLSQTEQK